MFEERRQLTSNAQVIDDPGKLYWHPTRCSLTLHAPEEKALLPHDVILKPIDRSTTAVLPLPPKASLV